MQNGFVESFNGRLRDELLNETLFGSIVHARVILGGAPNRPHSRLGWMTPLAYAATLAPATGRAAAQRRSFAPHPVAHPAQMGSTQSRILPIAG
jgi:putative transposase